MKKTALELLKEEIMGQEPPPGWHTITQLEELLGVRRNVIESFVIRKKWEVRKFRTLTTDNKSVLINHYNTGKL